MEDEAKGISQNDEELMKFQWIWFDEVLDEFALLEGKLVMNSWELWLCLQFSYN